MITKDELNKFFKDDLLTLKVVPKASKTELIVENNHLKLYLKAVPDKNKANQELIKFFKKEFKINLEIKSGLKSRDKVLKII